jgi:hypothetical protein
VYLASRIDNLRREILVLVPNHLTEGILNSRIVAVYEMTVDELHRQTRLAWLNFSQYAGSTCM